MTYSRNARRRAVKAGTHLATRTDSTAYNLFWHYTEPARVRARAAAALARVQADYDTKRAAKDLPARQWFPWRKSVTR